MHWKPDVRHLAVNAVPSGKSAMSMLWPRSTRTRPWSKFSGSKHLFSRNLKHTERNVMAASVGARTGLYVHFSKTWRRPLPQQEVVRLDVSVDDVDGVQLLYHGQDADGQVHDKRLRHQLLTQGFVDVHCILGAESDVRTFLHTPRVEISKLPVINMAISAYTNQQGAVTVEVSEQNAAVVEQVS